jgi:hypothetical protein
MTVENYIVVFCIMMPCSPVNGNQSFRETCFFQLQIIKWNQYFASNCVSDWTSYLIDQNKNLIFLSSVDVMLDLSLCYS